MKRNCLNCKYEPEWGDPIGNEYPRRIGDCKLMPYFPPIPAVIIIRRERITRYSDDSGIPTRCRAWESKE